MGSGEDPVSDLRRVRMLESGAPRASMRRGLVIVWGIVVGYIAVLRCRWSES